MAFGKGNTKREAEEAATQAIGASVFELVGELHDAADGIALPGHLDHAVAQLQSAMAQGQQILGDKALVLAREKARAAAEVEVGAADYWTPDQQRHFRSLVEHYFGRF